MMSTFDDLKTAWEHHQTPAPASSYTRDALERIIRSRVKKHIKKPLHYFWASFTLQIIVYALLSHVAMKYWQKTDVVWFAVAGVLLYLPFTVVLIRKFKKLASEKPVRHADIGASLYNYVHRRQTLLRSFYRFKKGYELFLIPLSSAIGVVLTFELYVPGGIQGHWPGAAIALAVTLVSCAAAIYSENRKSFIEPIRQLQNILDEFGEKESEVERSQGKHNA